MRCEWGKGEGFSFGGPGILGYLARDEMGRE